MTLTLDSVITTILLAILGTAMRAVWLVAEIKTTLTNQGSRLDNHEQRIVKLEENS